jgi:hypothetical protein
MHPITPSPPTPILLPPRAGNLLRLLHESIKVAWLARLAQVAGLEKFFEGQGVPVGLVKVEYRVRAQLSTRAASPCSNAVGFNFGTQGSPAVQATAGSIVPVKAEDRKSAG